MEDNIEKVPLPYLIAMRPVLMLGSVAGVRECLGAARIFTRVWLLSRVAS